ncbi:MAG TPA: lysine--tRNA ligase [Candidatus Saccharimonadales bacterium]|nr:lysine--tRNA ligase [Candidatus Saccharimonadales bacterium]
MKWLNTIVDELIKLHPEGEITISSGVSPSGKYHLGTLREVMTAEVIANELKRRGRQVRHLHIVDDLDVFRKVPADLPATYKQYLGKPLCDIPAPDGSNLSYADFYLKDLTAAADKLNLNLQIIRAHEKYRQGIFNKAIEKSLNQINDIREILEKVSGHKLDSGWSPIQIMEDGYLKTRPFISLNTANKTIEYQDFEGKKQSVNYSKGDVKLNWRVDWPARWWLLNVEVEPFGRDHATKGGSYETGSAIVKQIFEAAPPLPVPYNFINRTGETKKMSKSAGDTITAIELLEVLPAEVVWYFILRSPPAKQLYFDEQAALIRIVDEFSELLAKPDKTEADNQLIELSMQGIKKPTISSVPFSHLVASYQAALKDKNRTLEIIGRTEHRENTDKQAEIIKKELDFIDHWLNNYAPEDVKFALREDVNSNEFTESEQSFLNKLAGKIDEAPNDADGNWFHTAIYDLKDDSGLEPKQLFETLYKLIIGKTSGPRGGWFLSILPRDWLLKRLRLEA